MQTKLRQTKRFRRREGREWKGRGREKMWGREEGGRYGRIEASFLCCHCFCCCCWSVSSGYCDDCQEEEREAREVSFSVDPEMGAAEERAAS
jgi:hypothetical protein